MVPVGRNNPDGLLNRAASVSSNSFTVGSSRNTSSPRGADNIARNIPSDGFVIVSDLKSTRGLAALKALEIIRFIGDIDGRNNGCIFQGFFFFVPHHGTNTWIFSQSEFDSLKCWMANPTPNTRICVIA
jgi:hypothetical protein